MSKKKRYAMMIIGVFSIACLLFSFIKAPYSNNNAETIIKVDTSLFLKAGLAEPITIVSRKLSNGQTADCYKIVTKSIPTDHAMGPWCPSNISDDASKGGIWIEGGKVYDVDGAFIKNLAAFYKDSQWMMYDKATGGVTKTKTLEDCAAAARPNVDEEYKNYCVECLPAYVSTITRTIYLPVIPVKLNEPISFNKQGNGLPPERMPGKKPPPPGEGLPPGDDPPRGPRPAGMMIRGIAFNGVIFDPPAPVNAILDAYTLAPFDDAGGHINLLGGYHYHAAMGLSTKIKQADGHAAMIGYALDGFGIYENLNEDGEEYTQLDANRGHYDTVRGYHYHVDKPGSNNFINGLAGAYVK